MNRESQERAAQQRVLALAARAKPPALSRSAITLTTW
jgi:hypothetical protein